MTELRCRFWCFPFSIFLYFLGFPSQFPVTLAAYTLFFAPQICKTVIAWSLSGCPAWSLLRSVLEEKPYEPWSYSVMNHLQVSNCLWILTAFNVCFCLFASLKIRSSLKVLSMGKIVLDMLLYHYLLGSF